MYSAACLILLVSNSSAFDGFKFPDGRLNAKINDVAATLRAIP